MKANEQAIIKQYLHDAYFNLKEARKSNKEFQSERFPMVSKELAVAQSRFDILCGLARELGVANPYERLDYEILCVDNDYNPTPYEKGIIDLIEKGWEWK